MSKSFEEIRNLAIKRYTHLQHANNRTLAQNACHLAMAPGLTLADYWTLADVANAR